MWKGWERDRKWTACSMYGWEWKFTFSCCSPKFTKDCRWIIWCLPPSLFSTSQKSSPQTPWSPEPLGSLCFTHRGSLRRLWINWVQLIVDLTELSICSVPHQGTSSGVFQIVRSAVTFHSLPQKVSLVHYETGLKSSEGEVISLPSGEHTCVLP